MMLRTLIMTVVSVSAQALAAPVGASEIAVPSGRTLTLFDVIMEPAMARFRFVLPQAGDGVEFVDLVDDLQFLCEDVVVPALDEAGQDVPQLVISVSASEVPFGEPTDVAQFFQPFGLQDGTCVWEEF